MGGPFWEKANQDREDSLPARGGRRFSSLAPTIPWSSEFRERRDRTVDLLNDIDGVRCFKPAATFYLFPNVTDVMKRKALSDYSEFRKKALQETGVSFCTRTHFGRPLEGETEYYIRLAYSGIDVDDIGEALERFKAFAEAGE